MDLENILNEFTCVVCLQTPTPLVVFWPCAHANVCESCVTKLPAPLKCPVCRSLVQGHQPCCRSSSFRATTVACPTSHCTWRGRLDCYKGHRHSLDWTVVVFSAGFYRVAQYLLPSDLCSLASIAKAWAPMVVGSWRRVMGFGRLEDWPFMFTTRIGRCRLLQKCFRRCTEDALLKLIPDDGTMRPMAAGSYSLRTYMQHCFQQEQRENTRGSLVDSRLKRKFGTWSHNDVDVWFVATEDIGAAAREFRRRVRKSLGCEVLVVPFPTMNILKEGGVLYEEECEEWPPPYSESVFRGGGARLDIVNLYVAPLDARFADREALKAKVSLPRGRTWQDVETEHYFMGPVGGGDGHAMGLTQTELIKISFLKMRSASGSQDLEYGTTHESVLGRFDLDICRIGVTLPSPTNPKITFLKHDADVFDVALLTNQAQQGHVFEGLEAARRRDRKSKYELRGFKVEVTRQEIDGDILT